MKTERETPKTQAVQRRSSRTSEDPLFRAIEENFAEMRAEANKNQARAADIDAILERLDQGIAAEQIAMDKLLERIASRTPR